MKLTHLDLGAEGKPPLILLHGLLGSSRNWRTAGSDLARHFHVRALDLRNHGESPHAPEQTFELMAADVLEWLDDHELGRVQLLGHSLGGKVAMLLACRAPERVAALLVVDIAPKPYPVDSRAFDALLRLDLRDVSSRRVADERLREDIPDRATRQFLLMNLVRGEGGQLAWQANLPALASSLPDLRRSPLGPDDRFTGRTLFIAGGRSTFILPEDREGILRHFPYARIEVLPASGHYPHVEDRPGLLRVLTPGGTGPVSSS